MKKLVYLMAAAACVSMAACGSKSKADYCQTGSENIAIYTEEVPQLDRSEEHTSELQSQR